MPLGPSPTATSAPPPLARTPSTSVGLVGAPSVACGSASISAPRNAHRDLSNECWMSFDAMWLCPLYISQEKNRRNLNTFFYRNPTRNKTDMRAQLMDLPPLTLRPTSWLVQFQRDLMNAQPSESLTKLRPLHEWHEQHVRHRGSVFPPYVSLNQLVFSVETVGQVAPELVVVRTRLYSVLRARPAKANAPVDVAPTDA